MNPIRPIPKQCTPSSSLTPFVHKEDMISVLPTSLPGYSSNQNQYVGDDAGDSSGLDSCFSKYTKSTNGSRSSFLDDNEGKLLLMDTPQKSQRK